MLTDSVQKSLEAKFSSGQAGAIPITPSPEFHSRIAVSYDTLDVYKQLSINIMPNFNLGCFRKGYRKLRS